MRCRRAVLLCLSVLFLCACANSKLGRLREDRWSASIRLPSEEEELLPKLDSIYSNPPRDTLKVTDLNGREVIIMKAIKDEESGEMVATEQIEAAYVAARFRNIAERNGRINIEFQLVVPDSMQDSEWQLRFYLDMFVLGDSTRLDDVHITGTDYRNRQLRGYERYERFLDKIITDSLKFVDMRNLEIFLARNIPELYAYKTDSAYVSESEFMSCFGVDSQTALAHYTHRYILKRNERLINMKEKMWARYVKSPLITEGVRLDTVLRGEGGEFIYNYIQTINTRPKLRKVDICLSGEIFRQEERIYTIPRSAPLTFYVSSVSSFADETPRYLTKIISRNLEMNETRNIAFRQGSYEMEESLSSNPDEIRGIKTTLRELVDNDDFELDSIVIAASTSPEGSLKSNLRLSYNRAESVAGYFMNYVEYVRDSIRRDEGVVIDLAGYTRKRRDIHFKSRSGGENWTMLDDLVSADTLLDDMQKAEYFAMAAVEDADERELLLREKMPYRYFRDRLYPHLRTVRFNFHLHRKGMLKDTVHTTVLDENYMSGVDALKDHDYEKAIDLLAPYSDFNTAVAYVALDRNASALSVLASCPKSAKVDYLLAILYSRAGDDTRAVEAYLHACEQEPSFIHRGNLDPEISSLISKYNLNNGK